MGRTRRLHQTEGQVHKRRDTIKKRGRAKYKIEAALSRLKHEWVQRIEDGLDPEPIWTEWDELLDTMDPED